MKCDARDFMNKGLFFSPFYCFYSSPPPAGVCHIPCHCIMDLPVLPHGQVHCIMDLPVGQLHEARKILQVELDSAPHARLFYSFIKHHSHCVIFMEEKALTDFILMMKIFISLSDGVA